jgi:hypothetical protein
MNLYINCYQTYSSSNHQIAKHIFFDMEIASKHLEKFGTIYKLEVKESKDYWNNFTKLYVVMRVPQNKDNFTEPIDIFSDISKAKEKYLNYDYKKKNYRINEVFLVKE